MGVSYYIFCGSCSFKLAFFEAGLVGRVVALDEGVVGGGVGEFGGEVEGVVYEDFHGDLGEAGVLEENREEGFAFAGFVFGDSVIGNLVFDSQAPE